jgi:iron(III) transport system substrate-binding protein
MRKRLAILIPAALSVAALSAFFVTAGSADRAASGGLTIYSGQHAQTVAAIVSAFEKSTGIDVSVRYDDEGSLVSQIVQEGSHSRADVFMTENSPPLEALAGRGLLAKVAAATIAKTSVRYSSPTRVWAAVSARVSTLVYNTDALKPSQLPRSVLDLANPRWKGKLALAPTEADFQPIVTAVTARYGKARAIKWLQGIKANSAGHIYPDNEALIAQMNSGQGELSVVNHYYWYRLRDELGASKLHTAQRFFAPRDPGYVVDISGAGILKASSHQSEAQKFLAFLVSRTAQSILAHDESFEYPLGSGVVSSRGLVPFSSLRPDSITVKQLGDGSAAVALLRAAELL